MERRTVLKTAGAAMATISISGMQPGGAFAASDEPVVETSLGKVRGARVNGVYAFKGVRYAAPTGGENRFLPPQKAEPWAGVKDALEFGHSAPQTHPNPPKGPPAVILYQLFPKPAPDAPRPPAPSESEDCLFLNVWTSGVQDGRKRPVMVFLHAGFFSSGSGGQVNGTRLASRGDVVIVSLNHRLNVFGFNHLGDLAGQDLAQSGNAGMLDIVAALEWVRDNIDRFGGDPRRVMLFGESGGGMKTSILMASPRAQGLFHRAGVQSGPCLRVMERDAATKVAELALRELGLKAEQWAALKAVPMERLLAACFAVQAQVPAGDFTDLNSFAPVIDAEFLPRHPFDPEASPLCRSIPLLIGWNQTEMTFFMGADNEAFTLDEAALRKRLQRFLGADADKALRVYRKAYAGASPADLYLQIWSDYSLMHTTLQQAERKSAQPGAPVYLYRFDWRTPVLNGKLKSMHSLENPFVFDDVEAARFVTGGGEDAKALAAKMSAAWVSFAATGNPHSTESGLPQWPPYLPTTRETMLFDNTSAVVQDPTKNERIVLSEIIKRR